MYTLYGAEQLIADRERESQEISRSRRLEGEARQTSKEAYSSQGSGGSLLLREASRASKGPLHRHALRLGPLSIYW